MGEGISKRRTKNWFNPLQGIKLPSKVLHPGVMGGYLYCTLHINNSCGRNIYVYSSDISLLMTIQWMKIQLLIVWARFRDHRFNTLFGSGRLIWI